MENRIYAAIDLKSFYASVECVERGLDPMDANLVVADASRTEKTICLAVSPALKKYGVPGRPRLFEVVGRVREINGARRAKWGAELRSSSVSAAALDSDGSLALDYITAPPRMALYMDYSARIYRIYTELVAPEDIHVYSVDEVFMDITPYLKLKRITAEDFIRKIIRRVYLETGITATAGIGTNLYLCKVAMDMLAKHAEPDGFGCRIASLDEISYREKLWNHRPITDFWRVGHGYAGKLADKGIYTMADVARCSLGGERDFYNEELLFKLFGVNAELLIDHAWGREPCTMADIKAYRPRASSLGSGQVLHCAYDFRGARLIVREMADALALDLFEKGLATDRITLTVGYDAENLTDLERNISYGGEVAYDHYGRAVPKGAHGTVRLDGCTSSAREICERSVLLFEKIANPRLLVRRISITALDIKDEGEISEPPRQLDFFGDALAEEERIRARKAAGAREGRVQRAVVDIKRKFGKNSIIKGMNLCEGGTAIDRNQQIGGHRA